MPAAYRNPDPSIFRSGPAVGPRDSGLFRILDTGVERHVLCASFVVGRDGAEPGPDKSAFARAEDGAVYAFVAFKNLRGKHARVWKWYDPERALFRKSQPIRAGEDGRTFASYFAWDRIKLPQGRDPGMWTSSLFIDGILAASRTFEIRPPVPGAWGPGLCPGVQFRREGSSLD